MTDHDARRLLTVDEAAPYARKSSRAFRATLAAGHGPAATRIGGRVFIRYDHLMAWLDSCAVQPERKPLKRGMKAANA